MTFSATTYASLTFVAQGRTFIIDAPPTQAAVVESDSRRERQKQAARRFRERRRNMLDTLQKEVEDLRRAVAVLRGRNEALYAMLQSTEPNCNDVWLA